MKLPTVILLLSTATLAAPALAHESFSAGEPGNPKRPAKTVQVTMQESEGKMLFSPDKIEVRQGEQIHFVLSNPGELPHEFILASAKENLEHAAMMQHHPGMEHNDPNGKRLQPKASADIFWRFSKKGEFEFACLIPGHREAGMLGKVTVK
jgi:uncharacterized cupredoxin-like copper-binding protein